MNEFICLSLSFLIVAGLLIYFFPNLRGILYWAWCALMLVINGIYGFYTKESFSREARYSMEDRFKTTVGINLIWVVIVPSIFNLIFTNYYLWSTLILPFSLAVFIHTLEKNQNQYRAFRNFIVIMVIVAIF